MTTRLLKAERRATAAAAGEPLKLKLEFAFPAARR